MREGLCRVRTWQEASTPRTAIGASALRVREGRGRAHFRRKRRNRPQPVHRRRLGSGPRRPDSRAASTGTGPGQFMLCTGSGRPGRRLSPRQSDSPGIMPGTRNTAPRGKAARGGAALRFTVLARLGSGSGCHWPGWHHSSPATRRRHTDSSGAQPRLRCAGRV